MNKRHKILLNDKDSPHQCSLIIESATIADSGQIKFFSQYGGQIISECSLVVNESPQADHKHAFFSLVVVAVVIAVVLLTASLVRVYMYVKARRQRQANHQSEATNLDPALASPIELPLLSTSTTTQDRLETQEPTTMTTL